MKIRHSVWLLLVMFCCCKKKESSPSAPKTSFTFSSQFDTLISTYANTSVAFIFNFKVLSGDINTSPVTATLSGFPANISIAPDSFVVTNLLGGVFNITVGNIPVGVYTVSFNTRDADNGTRKNKVILKINAPEDYAVKLARTYVNSSDYCQPFDSVINYYITTANTVADTPYLLKITNLRNIGTDFVVRAWISSVITIPQQTVGAYTIKGSGTYTKDGRPGFDSVLQMTIYDTLITAVDTQTCLVHLQK